MSSSHQEHSVPRGEHSPGERERQFGPQLRAFRTTRGLTQARLAALAGCAEEVLRKFEAGAKRPSRQLAERLGAALRLSEEELPAFVALARAEPILGHSPQPSRTPSPAPEHWFARTKLQPPRLRADTLDRPRLLRASSRAVGDVRLLLLSAPAGAGKTTLLTTLIRHLREVQGPPLRLGWLSLDPDDNDLARFLTLLAAAWEPLAHGAEERVRPLLAAGQTDRALLGRQVVGLLVNLLLEAPPARSLLVIDDLHLLTNEAALATLASLLDQLPSSLTVAAAARHDPPLPLARLRARHELLDIRFADLRFTPEETAALLAPLGLDLPREELAVLHHHTEGWAAGLAMLTASLQALDRPAARVRLLDQLARTDRLLFQYLADEVIAGLDPFVRTFLLETSVLPELTPEACRAITGRADSAAILDDLYQRNLFLMEIGDGRLDGGGPDRPWSAPGRVSYRYHDLFRGLLQHRLLTEAPEWLRMLHRRAAAAERVPARRVAHYLQAGAWEEAAHELVEAGADAMEQGATEQVWGWIDQLPPQIRAAFPRLLFWRGIILWNRMATDEATAELLAALRGFETAGDGAGQADVLAWLALAQQLSEGQGEAAAPLNLPPDARLATRLRVASALGLLLTGNWRASSTLLDALLAEAEAGADPQLAATMAEELQLPFSLVPGGVVRFERLLACVERLPAGSCHPGTPLRLRATIALWRGRQEEAVALCRALTDVLTSGSSVAWSSLNLRGVVMVALSMDGGHDADLYLSEMLHYLERQRGRFARSLWVSFSSLVFRAALIRGELDEARRVAATIEARVGSTRLPFARVVADLTAGRLALAEGRLAEAAAAFAAVIPLQEQLQFTLLYGDAPLLAAVAAVRQGRRADALALLTPRLRAYAAEGLVGLLALPGPELAPALQLAVEHSVEPGCARAALSLLGEPSATTGTAPEGGLAVPTTGELLSAREVEVLRLLTRGASNADIAAALIISIHTAKHHVSSVLGKLGVASRAAAAGAARDLGLN